MDKIQNRVALSKIALFIGLATVIVPHGLFLLQPFFIDELPILINSRTFFSELTIIPSHAKYPTFYSYLVSPFFAIGAVINFLTGDYESVGETIWFLIDRDPLTLAFPGRVLSLAFLLLSVAVLYVFLRNRVGTFAGGIALILLLAAPAFLRYGSFSLPDTAVLFFSILSLIFVAKFLESFGEESSIKFLLIALVFSGLAISAKYNAFSTVVPIGFSVFYLSLTRKISVKRFAVLVSLSGIVCTLAFLLGSPGWLLKPQFFLSELMFEMRHAGAGHLGASGVPILGSMELLFRGAGIVLIGGALGFLIWSRSRNELGWIALVAILSSIALSTTSNLQTLHYMYPAFGGLLIFVAILVRELEYLNKTAVSMLVVLVLFVPVFNSYKKGVNYLNENTTTLAARWMYERIPEGSKVARDWNYVPKTYSYKNLEYQREKWPRFAEDLNRTYKPYEVVLFSPRIEWLRDSEAEFFVTSDNVYQRFFRFGIFTRTEPPNHSEMFNKFRDRREFYKELFNSTIWDEVYSVETGNGPPDSDFSAS